MAGTILSVGIVGCAATLAIAFTAVGAAAVSSQRLAGAADAAALAAADAASGVVEGAPCERAAEIAVAAGSELAACELDGVIATVTVTGTFGRFAATASARAGPPS